MKYYIFIVWGILVFFSTYFLPFQLSFVFSFFFFLFVSGSSARRLLKIDFKDLLGNINFDIIAGLITAFIAILFAVLFSLTITHLIWLYLSLLALMFLAAFYSDFKKITKVNFGFNKIAIKENLPLIVLTVFCLIIAISCGTKGADFHTDSLFHLSFVRKAFDGQPINPGNLSLVKSEVHIVYFFPVWQVFIGLLAKLNKTDIFTAWSQMPFVLLPIAFLAWGWLAKQIFGKTAAILTVFLFIVLRSNFLGNFGLDFSMLPIPEYLSRFVLLPLLLSLFLKTIYQKFDFKLLIINGFLSFLLISVHFPQFVYYLSTLMIFMLIVFIVSFFQKKDLPDKKTFLITMSLNLIICLALILFVFFTKGNNLFLNFNVRSPLIDFGSYAVIVLCSLGASILISIKYPKVLFLISPFLLLSLVLIPSFRDIVLKLFGNIFTSRIFYNLNLDFLIYSLLITYLLIFIARQYKNIKLKKELYLSFFIAIPAIIFIVLNLNWPNSDDLLKKRDWKEEAVNSESIGSKESIDFLRQLPSKSIILFPKNLALEASTLLDAHMVANIDQKRYAEAEKLYGAVSKDEKKNIIEKYKIDYIYVSLEQKNSFEENLEILEKIHENKALIYKVKK